MKLYNYVVTVCVCTSLAFLPGPSSRRESGVEVEVVTKKISTSSINAKRGFITAGSSLDGGHRWAVCG